MTPALDEPECDALIKPDCARCLEAVARASGAPSEPRETPSLRSSRELHEYPGLVRETPLHHAAVRDGVLAKYEFDDEVRCSFPGRHPHQRGLVVRTLCGIVLCMGSVCGKKHVAGFDQVERGIRNDAESLTRRRAIETRPQGLLDRLRYDDRRIDSLFGLKERARSALPRLAEAMVRRWQAEGARRSNYVFEYWRKETTDGVERSVLVQETVVIKGIDFWDPAVTPKMVHDICEDLRGMIADCRDAPWSEVQRLHGRLRATTKKCERVFAWIAEADRFFTRENVGWACESANIPERGEWLVEHFETVVRRGSGATSA